MAKKVLITGGAGFIGSHVAELFVASGHEVHVVDDLSTGAKANLPDGAMLHELDIRSPQARELIAALRPDAIVHLAAHIDLRASVERPVLDCDVNIMGAVNVLEAALAAGTRHLTFASSAAVYAEEQSLPYREDGLLVPASPYGISKLTFEHYLRAFRALRGLRSASLRFANVYGPRQSGSKESGVIAIFFDRLRRGEAPTINGAGDRVRDYVYVGDVARAVHLAATTEADGVCNVSTGVGTDVATLFAMVAKTAESAIVPAHGPEKPGDAKASVLDPSHAQTLLGWHAEVPLSEGLALTWQDTSVATDVSKASA